MDLLFVAASFGARAGFADASTNIAVAVPVVVALHTRATYCSQNKTDKRQETHEGEVATETSSTRPLSFSLSLLPALLPLPPVFLSSTDVSIRARLGESLTCTDVRNNNFLNFTSASRGRLVFGETGIRADSVFDADAETYAKTQRSQALEAQVLLNTPPDETAAPPDLLSLFPELTRNFCMLSISFATCNPRTKRLNNL